MGDHQGASEISKLADELWGPRKNEGAVSGGLPATEQLWGARPDSDRGPHAPAPRDRQTLGDPEPAAAPDGQWDVADPYEVPGRDADPASVSRPESADATPARSVPGDELEWLRSELEQLFAGQLAQVRFEVSLRLTAAEANFGAADTRLNERLDALAARLSDPGATAAPPVSTEVSDGGPIAAFGVLPVLRPVEVTETDAAADPEAATLQSQLEALREQLAWARSEVETTVATTEAIAVAAEARLAQELELVVERARSEAVTPASLAPPAPAPAEAVPDDVRRLSEQVAELERAVTDLRQTVERRAARAATRPASPAANKPVKVVTKKATAAKTTATKTAATKTATAAKPTATKRARGRD